MVLICTLIFSWPSRYLKPLDHCASSESDPALGVATQRSPTVACCAWGMQSFEADHGSEKKQMVCRKPWPVLERLESQGPSHISENLEPAAKPTAFHYYSHKSSKGRAWQLGKMTHFLPTQTKRLHLGLGKVSLIRPSVNHVTWVPLSNSSLPPFSPPSLKPAINATGTEENEAVGLSKYYWASQGNAAPLFRLPCRAHFDHIHLAERWREKAGQLCRSSQSSIPLLRQSHRGDSSATVPKGLNLELIGYGKSYNPRRKLWASLGVLEFILRSPIDLICIMHRII